MASKHVPGGSIYWNEWIREYSAIVHYIMTNIIKKKTAQNKIILVVLNQYYGSHLYGLDWNYLSYLFSAS